MQEQFLLTFLKISQKYYQNKYLTKTSWYREDAFCLLVDLLSYVHSKQLRPYQNTQSVILTTLFLSKPLEGSLPVLSIYSVLKIFIWEVNRQILLRKFSFTATCKRTHYMIRNVIPETVNEIIPIIMTPLHDF